MFKETPHNNETETVIGSSVKIEGDFVTEGNIAIEGIISGMVKTAKNIKVGPKAIIYANVTAENILVAGEIQGNIKVNGKLELTASAKIFGDIRVGDLVMASGATLNGKCQMDSDKSKSPKPDFSKQEKIILSDDTSADKKSKKTKI